MTGEASKIDYLQQIYILHVTSGLQSLDERCGTFTVSDKLLLLLGLMEGRTSLLLCTKRE